MSRIFVSSQTPGSLVANDPTDKNRPKRFDYKADGWTGRVDYLPRKGETFILMEGTATQAIVAATGMPTSTQVGLADPATGAETSLISSQVLPTLYGHNIVMGFVAPATVVKADEGKLVNINAATGDLELCNAATDNPFGVLRSVPDPAVNSLCEVLVMGPVWVVAPGGGVAQGDRIVLSDTGGYKVASGTDFLTTGAALNGPVTGRRSIGLALTTAAAGAAFLLFADCAGGKGFIT